MKCIIGLGNPGEAYASTRHNIGYMVVDKLARELGEGMHPWERKPSFRAETVHIGEVLLVKPLTYMNNSGAAVGAVKQFYKLKPDDVWVIHDDIDLPVGKIRIRSSGSSAGHHGVDSIMKVLGTDAFVRFRLGVGRGKENIGSNADRKLHHSSVISFVLSRFRQGEAGELKHMIKRGVEAVRIALSDGIDEAMKRFN